MAVAYSPFDWPGFQVERLVHCDRFAAALRAGDLAALGVLIAQLVREEVAQARAEERALVEGLAARVAAQSEILSRRAEKEDR